MFRFISALSPARRALLGVLVILLLGGIAILFAPPEGESNNTSGDVEVTPTVGVTNQVELVTVNREFDYQGVHVAVKNATLAQKFSDDRSHKGAYTLRVLVDAKNNGKDVIGLDYAHEVQLLLPDGTQVPTKRVSVKAVMMPDIAQSGFFDFPLDKQVPLNALKLRFNNGPLVPLAG